MATGKMFLEPSVHVFLKVYEKHGRGGERGREEKKKRGGGVIKIHRFCSQRVDFHCLKKKVLPYCCMILRLMKRRKKSIMNVRRGKKQSVF